jgi:hypothetical protein
MARTLSRKAGLRLPDENKLAAVQGNKLTYGNAFHNSERKELKYELFDSSSGVLTCGGRAMVNDGDARNADKAFGVVSLISVSSSSPKRSSKGSFGSSEAMSGEETLTEDNSDETGKEMIDSGEGSMPEGLGGERVTREDCSVSFSKFDRSLCNLMIPSQISLLYPEH